MKKYVFISLMIFISLSCISQLRFTVQGGIINSNNHIKQGVIGYGRNENHLSFNLGIGIKEKLCKKINSESSIFYTQKGYEFYSPADPNFSGKGFYHVNYLTLNQNFTYQLLNLKKLLFAVGAGGFIAKGIGGKYVTDVTSSYYGQNHAEGPIKFGNRSNDQFQSFDAGLNFLLRIGFKKFDITTMFSPSLTNHIPKASQQSIKEKLQSFSFNLGYTF